MADFRYDRFSHLEVIPFWLCSVFFSSQLLMILLKVADISNEVRPLEVAEPWIECLLEEFFQQVWAIINGTNSKVTTLNKLYKFKLF